jgi:histone acetyltransferase 1
MAVSHLDPTLTTTLTTHISLGELYQGIYQYILKNPNIAELTVEDPAEAFEDLRDKNDLKMLLANEQFMEEGFGEQASGRARKSGRGQLASDKSLSQGKLAPPANKAWAEKWRKDLKIAGVSSTIRHRLYLFGSFCTYRDNSKD